MAKRIFFLILIIGFVIFFLPTRVKLQLTKYPRFTLLYPLQAIDGILSNFRVHKKDYQYLQELTTQLKIENAQLREKIFKNHEIANSPVLVNSDLVSANIIARDNETGVKFLTIDKSNRNNLAINMPALNVNGVVGKIIETNNNQSIIETALSPSLKISALDQRSRVNGIIEYSDLSNLRFKYAFSESDIQPGDTIITSGLGGIFPRGLVIGVVIRTQLDPTRFFQYVVVKPTVNFNTIDQVFIITSKISLYEEYIPKTSKYDDLYNLKPGIPMTPRIR
jgi:rod shape-determining protein MreC